MATAILTITDECIVKINGIDLPERKFLSNKFKYEIPGARYIPAVRLGRWDGKTTFFTLGGQTYINLLAEILPYLEERGYNIQLDDAREYNRQFSFQQITEKTFVHRLWPDGHPDAGTPIVLRDYQLEAVNKFLGNTQALQELATGFGKTICSAALSYSCEAYGRTIIIVPNKSLVTQTEADYLALGLDVGVYFGDRKEFGRTHTICTWQSLNVLLKNTKNDVALVSIEEFLENVICVICDECHQLKADVLKALLTGVMAQVPIRWGFTGTIPKEEIYWRSLQVSIGEVISRLPASDLQEQGVLANCHVNIVQMVDYAEYKDYQQELKYLLENKSRLDYIGKLIENIRLTGNTLVLIDRVAPGKMLAERIKDAVFLSGGTKAKDRKEQYDDVAVSENKVLVCTYGVAAVGINIPRLHHVVLIEPGKSFVRVIQSIGRGLRKAEGKDNVIIWDISSTCRFAKRHLSTRKRFYNEAKYDYSIEKVEWQ